MPRPKFLEDGQKLNKHNILSVSRALKNRATKPIENKPTEVEEYFEDIERQIEFEKLQLLINKLSPKMSDMRSSNFVDQLGFNREELRANAMQYYRDILTTYAPNNQQREELFNFIDTAEHNANISFNQVAERVKNLIPVEQRNNVVSKDICFIPVNILLRRFDDFIVIMQMELSNNEIEAIGDEVNSLKSKFEYSYTDDITEELYSDETADLISTLNNTRQVNGKALNDDEIREYEKALMRANELFGKPKIDLDGMVSAKVNFDNAVDHDLKKNADEILRNRGFDPECVRAGYDHNLGPYYEVVENKEESYKALKEGIEFTLSKDTKEGLKAILSKLHEYGYDKDGITGEEGVKIYGLKRLYDAGVKYRTAISNPDPNERIKAIEYAKEVYDADEKIQELFKLIDKYMPVTRDNLAFPGNVDSLRTDGIPPVYRLDYIRSSHLANLYSLANLIEEKKWDIDDFLNRPMHYLKQYYKDDYLAKVVPAKMNEGLTGDDLIFNIGRYSLTKNLDNMVLGGGRIVEGIVCTEKNPELREQNAAMQKAFNDIMFQPYNTANGFRENVAHNKCLDSIIINPNATFKDLHIKTFNGDELKFEEPNNERFDEIAYIKENGEPLSKIRDRIELSILKYMKNETLLVQRNKDVGVMYLKSPDFVELCQKAVAKILTVRREEKDTEAYQNLEAFVRNKTLYVEGLVNEISPNSKFSDYMIVKNVHDHPLRFGRQVFDPTRFDTVNAYRTTLDDYDKFVNDNKRRINNQLARFINTQKGINNDIKEAYQNYKTALTKYNQEVRKLYGDNYKGEIDNTRSDKLIDAFTKKNELYNVFTRFKSRALNGIEELVRAGRIPASYYDDRVLQIENNDFSDIPPLFRTDKPYTMDEYIKLKHPNDYQNLTNEEKEVIFNSYKKTISRIENDFFARRFLISKELTDNRADRFEIKKYVNKVVENAPINEKKLEAEIIGLTTEEIENNHIGEENHKFDEIKHLRESNEQIADFKKNIDKKLINLLKNYKNAIDNPNNGARLPKLTEVLDLYQKATLKYLLAVGELDKNNPLYKDLKGFIVDGNGYINKIIDEENKAIDDRNAKFVETEAERLKASQQIEGVLANLNFDNLEEKLSFKMKDFGVEDYEINKYSKTINEFETFYKDKTKNGNYSIPVELEAREFVVNSSLQNEYEHLKETQNDYREIQRINNNPNERKIITDVDYPTEIRNAKEYIKTIKDQTKVRLCNYYRRGLISEDYFTERFRRLDKNDFTIPPFFSIDKMPSMNDYIKDKYPNDYKNLTKDEKNQIYNSYKNLCEENRRQFILNRFFIENGLTEFNKPTCKLYEDYFAEYIEKEDKVRENADNVINQRNQDLNRVNEKIKERNEFDIHKDDELDEFINDDILPNFNGIEEIAKEEDEDIIETHIENLVLKDEFDEMEEYQNQREYIADIFSGKNEEMIDPFAKWAESLRNLLKQKMGEEAYNEENIEEKYAYDPKTDSFVYWFDTKISSLEELLGGSRNSVFMEARNNLDDKWKALFDREIKKCPEYKEYFPRFFKDNDEIVINKENKDKLIDDSLNEDKDISDDSFMNKVYFAMKEKESPDDDELDEYVDDLLIEMDKEIGKKS